MISFTLSALITMAAGYTQASEPRIEKSCGATIAGSTTAFNLALTTFNSFSYVRHALKQARSEFEHPVVCVSGVALSRNQYQYVQYYIQVDIKPSMEAAPGYRFRFLYQDASVQAYHNVQGQPWIGIDTNDADAAFASLVDSAQFKSLDTSSDNEDPFDLAKQTITYRTSEATIDPRTISVLEIAQDPRGSTARERVHLVSWMTRPAATNPFADVSRTYAVLVSHGSDGKVMVAENVPLRSDFLLQLERSKNAAGEKSGPHSDWVQKLIEVSN